MFHVTAGRSPAIVFESGGGDDSSVWRSVAPAVGVATGATVVTYDRAGFGESDPDPQPYSIDRETDDLGHALHRLGVKPPFVLVAHSYGGFLAALFASRHPYEVSGIVLLDANLVGFFTDAEVARLTGSIDRETLRKRNPALLRVLEAFPATVRRMRTAAVPESIPLLDVRAEQPPVESPEEAASWARTHEAFDAASSHRRGMLMRGTGHFMMRDRPAAIARTIADFYRSLSAPGR